jgi:hypothetical protein
MAVPRSVIRGNAAALNSEDFNFNTALKLFSQADQHQPPFKVRRTDLFG